MDIDINQIGLVQTIQKDIVKIILTSYKSEKFKAIDYVFINNGGNKFNSVTG